MGLKELAARKPGRSHGEQMETALSHLRGYKSRQEVAVLGIGAAIAMIKKGLPEAAADELQAILNQTLKEAKRTVYDREAALDIAIKYIYSTLGYGPLAMKAKNEIKALCPDLFDEESKPEGTA